MDCAFEELNNNVPSGKRQAILDHKDRAFRASLQVCASIWCYKFYTTFSTVLRQANFYWVWLCYLFDEQPTPYCLNLHIRDK